MLLKAKAKQVGIIKDVVGTGKDSLQLLVVQPEGKSRLDAVDWINGARLGDEVYLGTKPITSRQLAARVLTEIGEGARANTALSNGTI